MLIIDIQAEVRMRVAHQRKGKLDQLYPVLATEISWDAPYVGNDDQNLAEMIVCMKKEAKSISRDTHVS